MREGNEIFGTITFVIKQLESDLNEGLDCSSVRLIYKLWFRFIIERVSNAGEGYGACFCVTMDGAHCVHFARRAVWERFINTRIFMSGHVSSKQHRWATPVVSGSCFPSTISAEICIWTRDTNSWFGEGGRNPRERILKLCLTHGIQYVTGAHHFSPDFAKALAIIYSPIYNYLFAA